MLKNIKIHAKGTYAVNYSALALGKNPTQKKKKRKNLPKKCPKWISKKRLVVLCIFFPARNLKIVKTPSEWMIFGAVGGRGAAPG